MKQKQIIKKVFEDHWKAFQLQNSSIPEYVNTTVDKMLSCRNPLKMGYHKYVCPCGCGKEVVVPHSCKSRFCNSCCKLIADKWVERTIICLPNCSYWHITFTIPKQLRQYFHLVPQLKEIFFKTGNEVLLGWFKERGVLPSLISAFHDQGRDLKFHPHLHCVLSCGGLDIETVAFWKDCQFIPFNMLRQRWKVKFLIALEGIADEDLRQELFEINWYVNVSTKRMSTYSTIHYIGRYAQRPMISESRVVNYDGNRVSFVYDDFRSRSQVKVTEDAFDFISDLIQHIHPSNFRAIRSYGLLANRRKGFYQLALKKLKLIKQIKIKRLLTWRERQFKLKQKDPLACPQCGTEMVLVEMVFPNIFGELDIFWQK